MPYSLTYYDEAKADIAEAKKWYHGQLKGLEKRFAEDIKTAIIRLRSNPHVHAIRYKNIRLAHPDVFPYTIHFYIDETKRSIVIIGIVHGHREPGYLKDR